MTRDPIKRQANNARYYANKKANQQGQPGNNNRQPRDWQDQILDQVS
jgi:hypothetical protein